MSWSRSHDSHMEPITWQYFVLSVSGSGSFASLIVVFMSHVDAVPRCSEFRTQLVLCAAGTVHRHRLANTVQHSDTNLPGCRLVAPVSVVLWPAHRSIGRVLHVGQETVTYIVFKGVLYAATVTRRQKGVTNFQVKSLAEHRTRCCPSARGQCSAGRWCCPVYRCQTSIRSNQRPQRCVQGLWQRGRCENLAEKSLSNCRRP